MKKQVCLVLTAILLALSLTACGGSKEAKEVTATADELAKQLTETVTSDSLASVSPDILASTYFVDMEKVDDSAAYLSSSATACEVAVIKCKDSAYTSEVEDTFKARVKKQSELYASYNTAEVTRLDAAIIKTAGNYVVLCVTDDTKKAEDILKEAGF